MPIPSVRLISCVGVQYDLAMLPHFLRHYRDLGVQPGHMHLILNAEHEEVPELAQALEVLDQFGVEPEEVWIAPYTSDSMWEKRRQLQKRVAAADDWVLSADVDELHEFPDRLPAFLDYCERQDVSCVQGIYIDRLAPDGRLNPVLPEVPVWDQFPVEADVICTIRRDEEGYYWYGTVNIMACKGDILPKRGGHQPQEDPPPRFLSLYGLAEYPWITDAAFRFAVPLRVHHFKWIDTMQEGVTRRLATPGVSPAGEAYGRLLLDHLERHGQIALDQVPIRHQTLFDKLPWQMRVNVLRLGIRGYRRLRTMWRTLLRWTR